MSVALRRFSIEELTTNALRFSTRFCPSATHGDGADAGTVFEGRMLDAEVSSGLYATGYDLTYLQDRTVGFEVDASLTCGLLLDGVIDPLQVPGHDAVSQKPHAPILVGFGSTGECSTRWRHGQRCAMAGFTLRPRFFERFGDSIADDGLSALARFFCSDFRVATLPATPHLSRIGSVSLDNPFADEMERLFLESNTLAMLIEVARLVSGREQNQIIPAHHRRLLVLACERLDADLASPPTTIELVREIGTNVTTLQRIFRLALDTTILGYVQQRRLEVARVMLQERAGTVGEIGYRLGYSSASAFSAAYRRHFGHSPSVDR